MPFSQVRRADFRGIPSVRAPSLKAWCMPGQARRSFHWWRRPLLDRMCRGRLLKDDLVVRRAPIPVEEEVTGQIPGWMVRWCQYVLPLLESASQDILLAE